ncbi:hypothetical protein G7077_11650 [Sphingomonas piscis]|uniref:Uncharacterized protein n=1 Tax=Sphingomonas piscis TaxID=2714943 RepID=A0A6G7YRU1_9SPHN|nr:hypothetical protein [Sphingomonas piscis]QIK79460.1 hypothetical protein G7077_11650 [Sphingomonas piscis]
MIQATSLLEVESPAKAGLPPLSVASCLLGLFAIDNLLLLHFLGLPLWALAGLIAVLVMALTWLCGRFPADGAPIPYCAVVAAFLLALALCALGGEGRFFYSNVDWQVRDAVLRDLATHPWPFAYDIGGTPYFLRAPIGLYLAPAMSGRHAEIALLLWSSLHLAGIFNLAWHLFERGHQRIIAAIVFVLFSGWDVVGTAIYSALGLNLPWDHIEPWNAGYQYSSTFTLISWVPHHAIAGWTCAVAFLLWRKGLLPVGFFAATIPLVALWSPLAVMGAVPFALFAGLHSLRGRAYSIKDVAIAALCTAVALPALFYLQIDAQTVAMRFLPAALLVWTLCIVLEVLPFVIPLLREPKSTAIDRPVLLLVLALLLLMPLVQIGVSLDFQMRASIMPLAILSILFAQWICLLLKQKPIRRTALAYALVAVGLGAVTTMLELRRSIIHPPSPSPLCSLVGVWHKLDNLNVPYSTYLVPLSAMPEGLRYTQVMAGRSDPQKCWDRRWSTPNGWATVSDD